MLGMKRAKNDLCGIRVVSVFVSTYHPPAEKGAHTLNRTGKRTRRPERLVRLAGGFDVLDCCVGCVDCSGGARAVTVRLSESAMMLTGFTLSVDTVTGRQFMAIYSVFFVRSRTLWGPL